MAPIDLYCERLGPGLLAEPVNALSNGAFFLAAWWIHRRARQQPGRRDRGVATLVALVVGIGVGSTLFHTIATPWTLLADVLPILAFQLVFLWLYLRRWTGLAPLPSQALLALFLAATLISRGQPGLLNGSLAYAPALLVLGLLGIHSLLQGRGVGLLAAAALFLISLGLRSIDLLICPIQPLGTHALWHGLNALVLALTCSALVSAPGRPCVGKTGG